MERIRNTIISVCFIAFIGITAICTKVWSGFSDLLTICAQQAIETYVTGSGEETTEESEQLTLANVEDALLEDLPYKTSLVEFGGTLLKEAGTRSYYNNSYGINITSTGYCVGCYDQTSTDYEVEQMISFKEYLDEKGIQLLYVSEPAKYIDDSFYQEEFGGESYLNRNTDLFLSRISEAGIDYIDLRDNIQEEGIDSLSLFYRTDHHWTVPAAKWAAEIIAERLNESYGYHIDLSLYDDDKFNTVYYEDAWLGEQGRKVAKSYVGLDDYTMMEPLYDTSYTIDRSSTLEGDFGLFIKKYVYDYIYDTEADLYTASLLHYSYMAYVGSRIHNNNADYGKILVLGDSYESPVIPFLTLGIQEVTLFVPRELSETTVREIVESGDYDTVIIAYAQFMIGAHDDESSANYKMFDLE